MHVFVNKEHNHTPSLRIIYGRYQATMTVT